MKPKSIFNILLLLVGLGVFLYFQGRKKQAKPPAPVHQVTDPGKGPVSVDPASNDNRWDQLNRRVGTLIYTKHARCRMDCRHIDESEVKEVLEKGTVNYNKSELNDARGPKFALEAVTHDQQHVRIIFAQDAEGTAVVTVIDLDHEWPCDCK